MVEYKEERNKIIKTSRKIMDDKRNLKETTEDYVFLASWAEVIDGGSWGLNAATRIKHPTLQAINNSRYVFVEFQDWSYFLNTPVADTSFLVRAISIIGQVSITSGNSDYEAFHSKIGIVPALQLSTNISRDGEGTIDNPWKP